MVEFTKVFIYEEELVVVGSEDFLMLLAHVLKANGVEWDGRVVGEPDKRDNYSLAFPRSCAYAVLYELSTLTMIIME